MQARTLVAGQWRTAPLFSLPRDKDTHCVSGDDLNSSTCTHRRGRVVSGESASPLGAGPTGRGDCQCPQ
jgi:hypothetical protein